MINLTVMISWSSVIPDQVKKLLIVVPSCWTDASLLLIMYHKHASLSSLQKMFGFKSSCLARPETWPTPLNGLDSLGLALRYETNFFG